MDYYLGENGASPPNQVLKSKQVEPKSESKIDKDKEYIDLLASAKVESQHQTPTIMNLDRGQRNILPTKFTMTNDPLLKLENDQSADFKGLEDIMQRSRPNTMKKKVKSVH